MRTTVVAALVTCTLWAGEKKSQRLYGLDWHAGLPEAFDAAKSRKDKKPVLWLRMLGDLAGKT